MPDDETFWITQKAMSELFDVQVPAIAKHLKNIYDEEELEYQATVSKKEIVQVEGTRKVTRLVDFYKLDAIIAAGYRLCRLIAVHGNNEKIPPDIHLCL